MRKTLIIILSVLIVLCTALLVYVLIKDNNKIGWVTDNNCTYYVDSDGTKETGWQTIDGRPYFFNSDGSLLDKIKVIDVSEYQGDIDWQKVADDGVQFAMIRSSYGWEDYPSQVDKNFDKNIQGAKSVGIRVGIYHYSYATTTQQAKKEADYCLKAISKYDIDLPIAYDIEEDNHEDLSNNELTNLAITFCEEIRKSGYKPMIYTKYDILQNKLNYDDIKDYDIWVAQYADTCDFNKPYLMWQYTEKGLINGIDGCVDFNYYYFKESVPHK